MTEESNDTATNLKRLQRSEIVQSIVSNKPGFIVRNGMMFFTSILVLIFVGCWFIKYPDIIRTNAKLRSLNAPKEVISKTSGKIVKLLAKEGMQSKPGDVLGYIEHTGDYDQVMNLSTTLDTLLRNLQGNNTGHLNFNSILNTQNLGDLQQPYQVFMQSLTTYKSYLSNGFYLRKRALLLTDLTFLKRVHASLLEQRNLNIQDVELSQRSFNASQSLKDDKIISENDYHLEKSKLINKKLNVPQITSSLINNEASQNEKFKEIAELENSISEQKGLFLQSLNTLRSQLESWKNKYIFTSPIAGTIVFATFLQENEQVKDGQIICYINPSNSVFFAEVYIPQANFGKIRLGQKILLKFPAYPFQEYGSLEGSIDFISHVTTDSGYLAKIRLPTGLRTNYNKKIQFREGLGAQGDIITQDLRLLERFYYNLLKKTS